jgi:ATPase, YjeE family
MITKNAEETKEISRRLATHINQKTTILLKGDLGAGKTTFTQGLAQGLGITKTVNSPTFTMMKVYQGRLDLYHIDAYRLEGLNQDLGFEDQLEEDAVCVIEWPEYIESILPEERLEITMNTVSETERELIAVGKGLYHESLAEVLK